MKDKELRNAGLKVTSQRLKILKILEDAEPHHISAEDVYKKLLAQDEDASLATIYRVLAQFEAAGIIKRHQFSTEHSVFELDQGEHHDHLVCNSCGKVVEFIDEQIELRQEEIAAQHAFTIQSHNHIIYGLCGKCAQN